MLNLDLKKAKKWLRLDVDDTEDDDLIRSLIVAAKSYLIEATGTVIYGKQTDQAKLVCLYLISHWYEDRGYDNRTPMAVRKPVITSLIQQITYRGGEDESESRICEPSTVEQASGDIKRRVPNKHSGR